MDILEALRQKPLTLLWLYLAVINLLAFVQMGLDKHRAVTNQWRIPEARLFLPVLLGGAPGGIAGIYVFRHKTRRKKFTIGFPAVLILQAAAALVLWQLIK